MFVTSEGSPGTRFALALEGARRTGNANRAITAAREMDRVGLPDALRLCLVLRDTGHPAFDRAVQRWLERFRVEAGAYSERAVEDAIATATRALAMLADRPDDAMEMLQALCLQFHLV